LPINDLEHDLFFLRRFLKSPKQVASVWPSSRFLAARMFDRLGLKSGDVVIEYGPGTGSLTQQVALLQAEGVDVRYLGIERDAGMYVMMKRRFPDLDFVRGDAADVVKHAATNGLPAARAVISGLPLILMDYDVIRDIIAASAEVLDARGEFRTFSYVHSYPSKGAGEVRELIEEHFEEYRLGRPVIRNLPPAFALSGSRPRRTYERSRKIA